jgi:hypothetical protein
MNEPVSLGGRLLDVSFGSRQVCVCDRWVKQRLVKPVTGSVSPGNGVGVPTTHG